MLLIDWKKIGLFAAGTFSCVQENASDILAEAKDINEERAAKEEAANIEE